MVVFPEMLVPLFVGRPKSISAIELALEDDKRIFLCTQKDPQIVDPTSEDIYTIGTLAYIHQVSRLPEGMLKLLIEGETRMRLEEFSLTGKLFTVTASVYKSPSRETPETTRLRTHIIDLFHRYAGQDRNISKETTAAISDASSASSVADLIAAALELNLEERQFLLEIADVDLRLKELTRVLQDCLDAAAVEQKVQERIKEQMERNQREYYLNEQMKAIRGELADGDQGKSEFEELEERIVQKKLPEHVEERAKQELKKLKLMTSTSAEAAVIRNYLDWILAIPWTEERVLDINLEQVRCVLDQDHYGLDQVKDRIIEFLAVRSLTASLKGPKLCLVGPPGVGKTSLARSIAHALGLEFVRQSLGGVRDEAEIRGHRRTYIGAMPGRIVQGLKKVKTCNPVFLLDEIDKLAQDFRGDPGSALLEVLDPEQNDTFIDHYLDLELDLSNVFFVTTANTLHTIHNPLQDRLEIIEIGSYTDDEKVEIALKHLIPKQLERNGLDKIQVQFQRQAVLKLIHRYTREAGVRRLEQRIGAIARKIAVKLAKGTLKSGAIVRVTPKAVSGYLGPEKFPEPKKEKQNRIGVTQGLAWTEVGGQQLVTEVSVLPGSGQLEITGKLGDVMCESARAAMSYVRSRAEQLNIDPLFYKQVDIHIHVPEGAVPKDGPSAGITMATALVSALTHLPVRGNLAMTGEITLRGRILPVGGLKEKILAAYRGGIYEIVIPKETESELTDIPEYIQEMLTIHLVEDMDQVLRLALVSEGNKDVFRYLEERGTQHPLPGIFGHQQVQSPLPA
ncbi:lon protease 1-like [Ylistrum balloti]|uniref:lon protease 1-like n=1 Tax=Ylistrum balloti TaxID=509963 RepID=UPI002905B4AC|nr:lon protease 1-like [Ylistrum balloti]